MQFEKWQCLQRLENHQLLFFVSSIRLHVSEECFHMISVLLMELELSCNSINEWTYKDYSCFVTVKMKVFELSAYLWETSNFPILYGLRRGIWSITEKLVFCFLMLILYIKRELVQCEKHGGLFLVQWLFMSAMIRACEIMKFHEFFRRGLPGLCLIDFEFNHDVMNEL